MDELCSDRGGNYTQRCWGFDAGTSNDIAFRGISGQLSSFSVSPSHIHSACTRTHACALAHACTDFGISGSGHHTTMDAE